MLISLQFCYSSVKFRRKTWSFPSNFDGNSLYDMMTPEKAAKCNGEIKKWWKSYREEAIKKDRA